MILKIEEWDYVAVKNINIIKKNSFKTRSFFILSSFLFELSSFLKKKKNFFFFQEGGEGGVAMTSEDTKILEYYRILSHRILSHRFKNMKNWIHHMYKKVKMIKF